jgi:ribosomal protein S18 acetylase RimI-like enzyme
VSTVDFGGHILARVMDGDEVGTRSLQKLLDDDASTWALLEGAPPRPDEARQMITDRPPGVTPERKYVWIWGSDAVIDIVEGYPDATTWYLGLIFIAPRARNTGLGAHLMRALAEYVRAHGGTAVRLAVVTTNVGARRLYDRLGFAFVDRRKRGLWTGDAQECDVLELRL